MSDSLPHSPEGIYRELFRNRSFRLLWSGQAITSFGDAFFNIAVLWMVYSQTGSTLQTALVQVVWQLPAIAFGPIAGAFADHFSRATILIAANGVASVVAGLVGVLMLMRGEAPLASVFAAIFLLNSLATFSAPVRFAIMPAIVDRQLLPVAQGILSSGAQIALFVGSSAAGLLIAAVGAAWAVMIDAASFLLAALAFAAARFPGRSAPHPTPVAYHALSREIREGWQAIASQPLLMHLIWFGVLINVSSFLGPLFPALVSARLGGEAAAYGALEAAGIGGAIVAGIVVGGLSHHLGTGRTIIGGWIAAGICFVGIAVSRSFPLTLALEAIAAFGLTSGAVSLTALSQALVPDDLLGRFAGISRSLAAVAIPTSALLAGWLADEIGVAPLFAFGGVWILGIAGIAWTSAPLRDARL